ncbi:hypothetical protein T492DRAFT_899160 [Pavlovales sp. CCMP2436]|nr:hypothetical protein T492DRAFT_899160 [Pavlovales sp. CCMP2436]
MERKSPVRHKSLCALRPTIAAIAAKAGRRSEQNARARALESNIGTCAICLSLLHEGLSPKEEDAIIEKFPCLECSMIPCLRCGVPLKPIALVRLEAQAERSSGDLSPDHFMWNKMGASGQAEVAFAQVKKAQAMLRESVVNDPAWPHYEMMEITADGMRVARTLFRNAFISYLVPKPADGMSKKEAAAEYKANVRYVPRGKRC